MAEETALNQAGILTEVYMPWCLGQDYGDKILTPNIRQSEDFPKTLSNPDQNVPLVLAKPRAQAVEDLFIVSKALLEGMNVTHHG